MAAAYLQRMGERIRERRDELGLSRSDVARAMPGKTNENALYRWEKGLHRPNDDALEALAKVLKVDPAHFLTDQPQENTGDLMVSLNGKSQLDRIERLLTQLLDAHEALESRQTAAESALTRLVEEVAALRRAPARRRTAA